VLDIMRALVAVVPVNEDWYNTEYPSVVAYTAATGETAAVHFRKHGYFEGREPFPAGWKGRQRPTSFLALKTAFQPFATRGRLFVEIEREAFLDIVKTILRLVPVDEAWYRATYARALNTPASRQYRSAIDHYVERGYFEGFLPADIEVDEAWYVARYDHVRNGLARGVAVSAKDHFLRIGYGEGCQPVQY
jgi:hypothetical protein